MTKSLSLLLLGTLLGACQGAELQDGGAKSSQKSADKGPSVVEGEAQAGPESLTTENEGPSPDVVLPIAAVSPIPVGGAYLTCTMLPESKTAANCLAEEAPGEPHAFAATSAYIMYGSSSQWHPVSFVNAGVDQNAWNLQLPAESIGESIAVILVDDENGMMADWIFQDALPLNLVADGSFEDKRILEASIGGPNQFLEPAEQDTWKASVKEGSTCLPIIEMQNTFTAISESKAADGTQWVELDSICTIGDFSKGNEINLFQDLKLRRGHYYSFKFAYKLRGGVGGAPAGVVQNLSVKMGGETILEKTTSESEWTRFEIIKKVASDDVRLEFKDNATPDGRGTLLDAVEVMHMGDGVLSN